MTAEAVRYVLADQPVAVVEASGCTQVPAFVPFTALPNGCAGVLFAIVRVLSVEPVTDDQAELDLEPVPWDEPA